MKELYSINISIAGKPISIRTNNPANSDYIKSSLKYFLGNGNNPFFTIYIDSGIEQPAARKWNISIVYIKGKFVFINKRKYKPDIEIGYIDEKKRIARLNTASRNVRNIFHPFLVSSFAYFLSEKDGFIIHAAGVIFKNNAYIFVGPSGSGKTTITKILKKRGINIISDEKIVISRKNDSFFAFGFPWGNDKNRCAPVKNILFLKKSDKINFRRLSHTSAIAEIFPQITLKILDEKIAKNILDTLSLLFKKVPGFKMKFLKNDSFWDKLENLD